MSYKSPPDSTLFLLPRQHWTSSLPLSSEEEFAGWGSTSLLHKKRCCISLGIRFITASKQGSRANHIGGIPALSPALSHKHAHNHRSCTKRHKANKSWESWFGRQRSTSRTLILCDYSLLCTSKWHITVSVVRMAAGCLETFFFPVEQRRRSVFGTQRGWACGSWPYSSGQRSSTLSEKKIPEGVFLEMASSDPGKKALIRPVYRPI